MKAQVWSTDIIIAIVVFSVIFMGFFYVTGIKSQTEQLREMTSEAEGIPESLTTASNKSSLAFIEGSKVDQQKLEELANMNYEDLKRQLGIERGDFCIHFEDEEGNIIAVSGKAGIGSGRVEVSGNTLCNETLT